MIYSIDFSTIQLILLIGGAQSLLFFILFLRQYLADRENLAFPLIFFVLALRLMVYPFIKTDFLHEHTTIPLLSDTLLLMLGPLIYLHTLQKLNLADTKWGRLKVFHFVPVLYFMVAGFVKGADPVFNKSYAVLSLTMLYAMVSLVLIQKHDFGLGMPKAKVKRYKRRLFKVVVPFLFVPLLIAGLVKYSFPVFGFGAATIPYVLVSAMFYRMTLKMMLGGKSYLKEISPKLVAVKFDPAILWENAQVAQLISFMEDQKPYLDPGLDLGKLAQLYGIRKNALSVLINQDINIGFNDFINYWRVEAAKKYLLDASLDHLTIVGLGHRSGFKSKSTFFESFKKYTGMTPNTYMETASTER